MAEETRPLEMFHIPAAELDKITAHDGSRRARINVGNYTFEVGDLEQTMKSGDKRTYLMVTATMKVVHAYEEGNKQCVGMEIRGFYAGDMNAHPFMLQRTKSLFDAIKPSRGAEGIKASEIKGKRFDGSIVWEISTETDKTDPLAPKIKQYVNDRLKGERPVGSKSAINVQSESAKAIQLAKEQEGGGSVLPWEKPVETAAQPMTPAAQETAQQQTQAAEPENDDETWTIDAFRALIKMNHEMADQARSVLTAQGLPFEGPIDPTKLPGSIKAEFLAWEAANNGAKGGGLPALDLGKKGKKQKSA